jgi:hypothetical protein
MTESSFGLLPRNSTPAELARSMLQIGATLAAICSIGVAGIGLGLVRGAGIASVVSAVIAGLAGLLAVYGSRSVRTLSRVCREITGRPKGRPAAGG